MSDYRDQMTLEEVALNDREMVKDAIKNCKRYRFYSAKEANVFLFTTLDSTLKWLGVDFDDRPPAHVVANRLKAAGIQIEDRTEYRGDHNKWRNGVYVYKNGELVAFVSKIYKEVPSKFVINQRETFNVFTNGKINQVYMAGVMPGGGYKVTKFQQGARHDADDILTEQPT